MSDIAVSLYRADANRHSADGVGENRADAPTKKAGGNGCGGGGSHRLGPKANMGAINANLRALDRTKKPTRKWIRRGLELKSFTGIVWNTSSWKAPVRDVSTFAGDVKSDSTGSSDVKPHESSAVASEAGRSGAVEGTGDRSQPTVAERSPTSAVVQPSEQPVAA